MIAPGALFQRIGMDRIGRQITAFILISVIASQVAVVAVAALLGYFSDGGRPPFVGDDAPTYVGRALAFGQILGLAAADDRPAVLRSILGEPDVRIVEEPDRIRQSHGRGPVDQVLRAKLPVGVVFDTPSPDPSALVIRLRVGDIGLEIGPPPIPLSRPPPLLRGLASLVGLALALAVLLIWASRMLTGPLEALAGRVAAFDGTGALTPLPVRGPAEVKRLAEALTAMQARVNGMIENRTVSLAAIGHDLRTPLTRLRLRAETIADATLRTEMVQDLDRMQRLTASALDFLSGRMAEERFEATDAASLIATVADEFEELGHRVQARPHPPVRIVAKVDAVQRALANLVENAVRYGTRVDLSLESAADAVTFLVCDDGPGIPVDRRTAALQPFVRLDGARGDERGGFGLGLAIVRAVAEDHGGSLRLDDAEGGGLCVRLTLPKRGRSA